MFVDSKDFGQAGDELPQVVLVLGKTGVGKSTFIRAATDLDVEIGDSLSSCNEPLSVR